MRDVRSFAAEPPPLLPPRAFVGRALRFAAFGIGGIGLALAVGTWGYHAIARLPWIDAAYNAAMILAGMGPADPMPDDAAKIWGAAYAIGAGLIWAAMVGIILYPFVHRMLHAFHIDMRGDAD